MHLLTVGHSNRSLDELLALLDTHGVRAVADVRRHPASRRHPHFSMRSFERSLGDVGVHYVHLPELGGMREPRADSPHTALAEGAFRGYADHMGSDEFARGLSTLLTVASRGATAFLCAEADPGQCHRALLADALLARGHTVAHILDRGPARPHVLHARARAEGERVVYDGAQARLPL